MDSGYCNLSIWLEPGRCTVRGKAEELCAMALDLDFTLRMMLSH